MKRTEDVNRKIEDPKIDGDGNLVILGNSDDFIEDEPVEVVVDNKVILATRVEGKVYAVDGICTHQYAELAEGDTEEHLIYCPLHFACFDMRTGEALEGPTDIPLGTYEVKESDGSVWIKI